MRARSRFLAGMVVLAMAGTAASAWAGGQKERTGGPASVEAGEAFGHGGTSGAATPIDHVVVIFDENISFDHYFATYPRAANPAKEPPFFPAPGTPAVNGLTRELRTHNPNLVNPERLDRSEAMTPDMDHGYTAEQRAFDGGLMDRFVESTGHDKKIVMDYYDGNTVTALWNYAQHFTMSDNSFGTTFGPSTPGALNLAAGQTHGASAYSANISLHGSSVHPGEKGYPAWALNANGTDFSDIDPYFDDASKGSTLRMSGKNIGDLLDAHKLTWGWFEGGFLSAGKHRNVGGAEIADYIPHHEPFQYYRSTANPDHLPPTSVAAIGRTDRANHQYGMSDFLRALKAGNLPSVSFLKAPGYEDGHAGYSDPIDEQRWLVEIVNRLERSSEWDHTAIFISWDDSDGWYDHVMGPIVTRSDDPKEDALVGPGEAGTPAAGAYLDRAGYGPRLPLLVISPWAKRNFVAHSVSDQSSIIRFIEDNWHLGRLGDQSMDSAAGRLDDLFDFQAEYRNTTLFLDPSTGEPVAQVAPEEINGQLSMSVEDLAQSLDVSVSRGAGRIWFTYGAHLVILADRGSSASVDGKTIGLGAPVRILDGREMIPVDRLAQALGVEPVKVTDSEILFRPSGD